MLRNKKLTEYAVFLELVNALDSLWHGGLLLKMFHLVRSYLSNRQMAVKFRDNAPIVTRVSSITV